MEENPKEYIMSVFEAAERMSAPKNEAAFDDAKYFKGNTEDKDRIIHLKGKFIVRPEEAYEHVKPQKMFNLNLDAAVQVSFNQKFKISHHGSASWADLETYAYEDLPTLQEVHALYAQDETLRSTDLVSRSTISKNSRALCGANFIERNAQWLKDWKMQAKEDAWYTGINLYGMNHFVRTHSNIYVLRRIGN